MTTVLVTPSVVQFVVGPVTGNRYVPNGAGEIKVADVDVSILEDIGFTVPSSGSSSLTVGTSPIGSGTDKSVLFDDAGILNEDAGLTYTKGTASLTVQSGVSPQVQTTVAPTGISISPDTSNAASEGFKLKSKAVAELTTGLAVAYFVPTGSTAAWMAVDISPHGAPADNTSGGGRGTAWIDICGTDEPTTEGGTYNCLSLGQFNGGDKHAVVDANTAVSGVTGSGPLYLQPSGGSLFIGSSVPYTAGLAQVQITKNSSSIGSEAAGISINTGTAAQPELLFGVDNSKTSAFIQSASTGTSFTTVPLVLNPNGGNVAIGSNAGVPDTFLSRGVTAASLQFGASDAAAPVAQTLRAQSVVAGNANIAGASFTLIGSRSNGSGVGGDIILRTTATGASSGVQNTVGTALTLKGGTQLAIFGAPAVLPNYAVSALPSASASGAGALAFVTDASTTLALGIGTTVTGGGANKVPVYSDGTNWIYG